MEGGAYTSRNFNEKTKVFFRRAHSIKEKEPRLVGSESG
jgi:hypothetical protein